MELPDVSRALLLGIGSDDEDLSLVPIESVTPEIIGRMAMQLLYKDLLDPPKDARSRIQVIDRALEVGGFTGKNSELHLHQHVMAPVAQKMMDDKMAELKEFHDWQKRKLFSIDAEIVTDATPN
jgi:hypothetical protein